MHDRSTQDIRCPTSAYVLKSSRTSAPQCRCKLPRYVSRAPATPPIATPAPNSMPWLPWLASGAGTPFVSDWALGFPDTCLLPLQRLTHQASHHSRSSRCCTRAARLAMPTNKKRCYSWQSMQECCSAMLQLMVMAHGVCAKIAPGTSIETNTERRSHMAWCTHQR